MPPYRALFTADVHMSNALPHARPTKKGRTDRLDDLLRFWRQVEAYADANCVPDLFILGDLFDKSLLDAVTLKETLDALYRWGHGRGDRRLFVLPGNHEESGRGSGRFAVDALDAFGATVLRNGERLECGDVSFWPVQYGSNESVEREVGAAAAPRSTTRQNVFLLHCSVRGASMEGRPCEDGVDPLLFDAFDAAISGHFHTHQKFGRAGFYLGAPVQHSFRDCGEARGFWDILFDGKDVRPKFVESSAPRFWKAEGWDRVAEAVSDARPGDYVRVEVACTGAEWKAREAASRAMAAEVEAGGFRVDLVHVPVYHHEARAAGLSVKVGEERPTISGMVRAYLKEPGVVTGDLDVAELERLGMQAVEAMRKEALGGMIR